MFRFIPPTVLALGMAVLVPALAFAAPRAAAPPVHVPHVCGEGAIFAFSGFDGKTSLAEPCVATVGPKGLSLKFRLPRDPVLVIQLAGDGAPVWQAATNDLLAARVPGDELPLVVGFMSANVVVGRLPPLARVALEGGDTNTVILRSAVGDRTKFAFAYDPRGSRAAADAAAAGLKASIDTLVETRLDFFAKAPRAPESTSAARAAALAKAWSVIKVNSMAPEEPIPVAWTTPARWPVGAMTPAASAFHALGLMHLDFPRAKAALAAVYAAQREDGLIPAKMGPGQFAEVTAPPLVAWAAWQLYSQDRMRDRDFLQASFDAAQKHAIFLMKQRRIDGEPPQEKPLEHGTPLYRWQSAEEAGQENSPRFASGADFAAVDLSCYLASECRTLQQMAQRLGYRVLAQTWGARAQAIEDAARKTFWREDKGFFYDRRAGGEWIDVRTAAGLLPLWAGVATPEQAERLRAALASDDFSGPGGVATVARSETAYKRDFWSGPAWVHVSAMLVRGLQRYGFADDAAALRGRTLDAVASWYARTGCLWEFYDVAGEAAPAAMDRLGVTTAGGGQGTIADFQPTASLYVDLLLRP
jgi:hypothetical protein